MDIISHTLTGVAVGSVFATFSNETWSQKGLIFLTGALGGALPDLDAISLYSKFDETIGLWLGLAHTGKEIYFGKFWYSHHAAFHSIFAPFLMVLLVVVTNFVKIKKLSYAELKNYIVKWKFFLMTFFFGFVFHLLEDMPTPACVWGGVNFFFPSSSYVGGYGKIWWWNNYDLVLIIFSVIVVNLFVNIVPKKYKKFKALSNLSVFVFGVLMFLYQIETRPVDFGYTGHTVDYHKLEKASKEIQKEILNKHVYEFMLMIDNKLPLKF